MTRSDFMLSAQRALLGFIGPNVRSVTGTLTNETITVRYIIDGEVDEDTREALSSASTLILADLEPEDYHLRFEEELVRLDVPASISSEALALEFYERFEPGGQKKGAPGFPEAPLRNPTAEIGS